LNKQQQIAVIGAGVSGLTCAVLLAENGYRTAIYAEETGPHTTSATAGAIWFPYDVEPFEAALAWALESYRVFDELCRPGTGVSMIELRTFCRNGKIQIPEWAHQLGATLLDQSAISREFMRSGRPGSQSKRKRIFSDGFTMRVPLIDTTIYLNYLFDCFAAGGGEMKTHTRLERFDEVPGDFEIVVNCAGIGAQRLVPDPDLEPHRGQVVIVPNLALPCAVMCDEAPLMYAIPRSNDCLFGGTNDLSDSRQPDPATTDAILDECSRVLNIKRPRVLAERVGLRPFRRSGIRLEADRLGKNRRVIHNYGHGGSGFTLSWGCAREVLRLVAVT
jgi:D-amino-acid oxidase